MNRITMFFRLLWRQCVMLDGPGRIDMSTAWRMATILSRVLQHV